MRAAGKDARGIHNFMVKTSIADAQPLVNQSVFF